jgi:hypothetical protein
MVAKRYQRDYQPYQLNPVNTSNQYASIQNSLAGFTSTALNATAQAYGRKNINEAQKKADAYDPATGAPALSNRGNRAAQLYNRQVSNAYEQSVLNDSVNELGVLATQYKDNPQAYVAAKDARRASLLDDAGPLAGVAGRQYDTVSARYEAEIRKSTMADSMAAAKQVETDTITASRQSIMESVTDVNFDETRIQRTVEDYDFLIDGSVNLTELEKVNEKRGIRQDFVKAANNSIIQDFIDQDDLPGAQKYINKTRNRQITDGSNSQIKKMSGWTPVQAATDMQSYLQQYADTQALTIKIDNDASVAEEANLVVRNEEANKTLVDMGNDITPDQVQAFRSDLSPTEFKQWSELARGKVVEQNVVAYNGLFADLSDAIVAQDFEAMDLIKAQSIELVREGRLSSTNYKTLIDMSDASRFDEGMGVYDGAIETFRGLQVRNFTASVYKAKQAYLSWKRQNPTATTDEARIAAEKILQDTAPGAVDALEMITNSQRNQ